jgi:hypothetical protein
MQTRLELAARHPVALVRLCAARGIDDVDTLHSLMQESRHRDKAVYRHCKDRLAEHQAQKRAGEELHEKLARLAEDAAALRRAPDLPEYTARHATLQERWKSLQEQAGENERERIQGDLDTCARRVERMEAERTADERERALHVEAQQTLVDLLAELEALDESAAGVSDPAAADELEKILNGIEERWVSALHHAQASAEQTASCKAGLNQWRALVLALKRLPSRQAELDSLAEKAGKVDRSDYLALQKLQGRYARLIRNLSWPEEKQQDMPAALRQALDEKAQIESHLERLRGQEKENLQKLEQAFARLHTELDTNHIGNADRVHNKLRNVLRQLPPDTQERHQKELRPLLARLKEVHDWQGFAIEPKKLELIESMKALIGVEEDPNLVASRVRALQVEWKKLGPLAPRRDQALWQQFHAAADEAYAPCKEAFARESELRRENFQRRMELIEQLVEYERRIAWPDREDADPGLAAPDWAMVRKTLDTARKAVREIKPVDRKGERKSQKALNRVCDRIYGHLKLEYGRNIERKKELIEQARGFVEHENLKQAIDGTKRIQKEWKSVGITPVKVDRRLWKEFHVLCDAVFARLDEKRHQRQAAEREKKVRARQREQAKQQRWQHLVARMRACAVRSADPEEAGRLWEADGGIPTGVDAGALESLWQDGPGDAPEEALREACIALEVLAGVDSPAEDKDARMAYQMQRLVEGMGSQQADDRQRLIDGINAFLGMRPSGEWLERYCRGLQAARGN